jgi:hypothetical protein
MLNDIKICKCGAKVKEDKKTGKCTCLKCNTIFVSLDRGTHNELLIIESKK